jgi:transketolase
MSNRSVSTDERFDKVDAQFEEMREQFKRQNAQFNKQFDAVNKQFDAVNKQFDAVNKQFDRIAAIVVQGFERNDREHQDMASRADMQRVLNLLDAMAKRQEISDEERLVVGHQLDRVNRWIKELADKIGYELTY